MYSKKCEMKLFMTGAQNLLLLLDVPNGILDDPNGKREMMDIIIILGFSQAWSLSADFSL